MAQFPHASYKNLLSHKEVMTHLAQGYLPEDLSGKFDLDSLELAPIEHTTGDLRRRADDLVWRLRRRNAGSDGEGWAYVFVVLEFQSSPDRHMAVRMLTYLGAFYEDLIAYPGLPQGTKLPEVLPVVIHNGQGKWNATCEVDDLIQESAPSLGAHRPSLRFKLLDAWRCEDARTERNLAEAIFRIERARSLEEAGLVMDDLVEWFARGPFEEVDRSFAEWLTALLRNRFQEREIPDFKSVKEVRMHLNDELIPWGSHQFAIHAEEAAQAARTKALAEGREEGRAEGLEKGREEGRAEGTVDGRREALAILRGWVANRTRNRFGEAIAQALSAALASAEDPGDIEPIGGWVETCENGEALLALVRAR